MPFQKRLCRELWRDDIPEAHCKMKSPDLSGSLLSKKGSCDLWLCPLGIPCGKGERRIVEGECLCKQVFAFQRKVLVTFGYALWV